MRIASFLLTAAVAGAAVWGARKYLLDDHESAPGGRADGGKTTAVSPTGRDATARPKVELRGTVLDIDLVGGPAAKYMAEPALPAAVAGARPAVDIELRRLVAEGAARWREPVSYDPSLARAAREVAVQAARLDQLPPEAVVTAILPAVGSPDLAIATFLARTTGDDLAPVAETIADALAGAPPGPGAIHLGVAEAAGEGPLSRAVVVLVARRDFTLSPTPTFVAPRGRWTAHLTAPGWRAHSALVLHPDGTLEEITPRVGNGATIELEVTARDRAGAMAVGVDGDGPDGPGKLIQLSVWVGDGPPRRLKVSVPGADPPLADAAAAEALAFGLLGEDRATLGQPALELDAQLAAVARAHSEDMRDHAFFSHRSPRTGLVGDRLTRTGYRASAFGENLARNDSITEAEASLVASLGHRANIVNPRFTRAGVGAARSADGQWYVTQVFARPRPVLAPTAARDLAARIDAARASAGLGKLAWRDELASRAQTGAAQVARKGGSLGSVVENIGEAVRDKVKRRAFVSAHAVGELEDVAVDKAAMEERATEIGIGAAQDPDSGVIGVVIVVGAD